jgi:hypothetical protein
MKRTLTVIFIVVVVVGAVAWHFFPSGQEPVVQPPPRPVAARPKPAGQPAPNAVAARPKPVVKPAPKPVAARASPAQKRLAPDGTFFLLQRASLTTDSTVSGFPPGTMVTVVRPSGSNSTVTDGQYQFDVPSSQLTNDLDIAARLAQADLDAQRKIAAYIANMIQEQEKRQQQDIATLEKQRAERERTQRPPARR